MKRVLGDLTSEEWQILLCVAPNPILKLPPGRIVRPHLQRGALNSYLARECVRKEWVSFAACHGTCLLSAFCLLCQMLVLKSPLLAPRHRSPCVHRLLNDGILTIIPSPTRWTMVWEEIENFVSCHWGWRSLYYNWWPTMNNSFLYDLGSSDIGSSHLLSC